MWWVPANNGDINADILWQHDGGQASVWLMDGMDVIGTLQSAGTPVRIGTSLHRRPDATHTGSPFGGERLKGDYRLRSWRHSAFA